MFEIKVKTEFEAAHRIVGYPGKCNRLHGHNWVVEVNAMGYELDDLGMLVDFKEIKHYVLHFLDNLDHRYLNELPAFSAGVNPTAENIARYIYQELEHSQIFAGKAQLKSICVWESPKSSVTYSKDE